MREPVLVQNTPKNMSTVEICQICLEFCRNVLIKPGSMSDRVQEVLKQAACRAARLAEKEALGMPPLDLAERSECGESERVERERQKWRMCWLNQSIGGCGPKS